MSITCSRRSADAKSLQPLRPVKTSISAAVFFAVYGVHYSAHAQQQIDTQSGQLQEVIVTAQRREQRLEDVPYSLSVVSADQLANTGVTDVASLVNQVPGLSMYQKGTRESGDTFPIIRGINVSATGGGGSGFAFRTFEQAPVGVYIGNSPISGYFQLDDVQRIEVLKGPQGTLYGAGALGGALRIIPNSPELNKFAGSVEVGGGAVAHSSGASYATSAMLNVPLGEGLAVRVTGKYAYEPGFINVYGILQRTGDGSPVLANPADPVNSPGIFSGKTDWNYQDAFTGRASALWKPVSNFQAELAFTYATSNGDGAPTANPNFPGGSYPIDPRITFPKGGDYQDFAEVNQPWSRRTTLASADLTYDSGFATLSSTSSYYVNSGTSVFDITYPGLTGYYAGAPFNPRFVDIADFKDFEHTFTQEVRLVSNTRPEAMFDYVIGVFYEKQTRIGWADGRNPGSPEYSEAEGCTSTYYYGATFPNCLLVSGPGDTQFSQSDTQKFEDKSVFGELTWHVVNRGQITFGGRHFKQSFSDVQSYNAYTFQTILPQVPRSSPASKNTWKVNPSYEYTANQHVYALWSQGFRRGGANSVPFTGIYAESNRALLSYVPDSINNYEIGLKGRFDNGLSYTFDVFDDYWDKPQVAGTTPIGNLAVWNANKARSTGVEFDLVSPLFVTGFSITAGGAYTNARFTKNYLIPADVVGNIVGASGQQLPGSPKVSAAMTINYERKLLPGYDVTMSLNDTYRSAEYLSTFPIVYQLTPLKISGMNILNFSGWVSHQSWRLGIFVTNLADKRVVLAPPTFRDRTGGLGGQEFINQPREIGLRIGYSFASVHN